MGSMFPGGLLISLVGSKYLMNEKSMYFEARFVLMNGIVLTVLSAGCIIYYLSLSFFKTLSNCVHLCNVNYPNTPWAVTI